MLGRRLRRGICRVQFPPWAESLPAASSGIARVGRGAIEGLVLQCLRGTERDMILRYGN